MNIKSHLTPSLIVLSLTVLILCSCIKPPNKKLKLPDPSTDGLEEVSFDSKQPSGKVPPQKNTIKPEQPSLPAEFDNAARAGRTTDQNLKGWGRLIDRLTADGIDRAFIEKVFNDARMPKFESVTFSLSPKESHTMYAIFLEQSRLKEAEDFYSQWNSTLKTAERKFGVPAGVITAIMYVETGFGKHTGNQIVLNRLSRLANIGEPRNVSFNTRRLQRTDSEVTEEQVAQRAEYLERTFYPEVLALFRLATVRKLDLPALRGSSAGAFGLAQFLPSSYVKYAVDGNQNGTISLFEVEDAIFSIGNFLSSNGWKEGMSNHKDKMEVLWNYNRSEAYGEMILKVADKLQ